MSNPSFSRVWDALTETPGDAAVMAAKTDLLRKLQSAIESNGRTTEVLAKLDTEVAADLRNGRLSQFSLEQLVGIAGRLGFRVHLGLVEKEKAPALTGGALK